jgi:hypothetical protein
VAIVPVSTTTPFVVVTPTLATLLLLSAAISDFTAVVIRMSPVAVSEFEATGAELDVAASVLIGSSGALAAIPLGADGVVGTSTLVPPSMLPATVATAGFSLETTAESVRVTLRLEVPTLVCALATGRSAADLGSTAVGDISVAG